jgi:hypothetical protein
MQKVDKVREGSLVLFGRVDFVSEILLPSFGQPTGMDF